MRTGILLLVCLALTSLRCAAYAAEGYDLKARLLYAEDFEKVEVGKAPPGVSDNSGWAGSTVPMEVVDSGDPRYGKVLECRVSGYCQIVLGQIAFEQGRLYRVTADISSRGAQSVTLILRHGPSPYTTYVTSIEKTNEEMHRFSFLGRAVKTADTVLLMLLMNGHTTLQIDNLRIEEVAGDLPPGDPPVPGNRLFNAGFELLGDGWFERGEIDFPRDAPFEGRHAARLKAPAIISSTWLPLSMESDYLVRARVMSLSEQCTIKVYLSNWQFPRGGTAKSESYTLKRDEGWRTVGFQWRPPAPAGKITRLAEYYFQVVCEGPQGGEVLVDAVEVKATPPGTAEEAFYPRAPLELAVTTAAPYNVATAGERVTAIVRASAPTKTAALEVRDEEDGLLRSLPLRFRDREARVALTGLPCGYWRLATRPAGAAEDERIEGETFLAVVPKMPDVPLGEWSAGTHITNSPELRKACWKLGLRWDRLHDTAVWSKWPGVQPEREQWSFDDALASRYRAEGHAILGLLDRMPKWAQTPLTDEERKTRLWLRPETTPLWEEYCRRTVAHWKGTVAAWEVMNEPYGHVSAPEYLKVLEAACRGAKAGDPKSTVIGLGGSGPSDKWLFECLKLGAGRHCDAISFHGYGASIWSTVNGPERLITVVDRIRDALKDAGTPDVPIWDTECGPSVEANFTKYRLLGGESGPLDAARMFPKSVAAVRASGLARILYYSGHQKTHSGDGGAGMYLADLDQTVRMGAVPLAVAVSLLEGRRYAGRSPRSDGVVDLVFAGRGATVRMLWCMEKPVEVAVPKNARQVLSMWGRPLKPSAGRISVGADPVYLVLPEGA